MSGVFHTYQETINGVSPLVEFNRSLAVYALNEVDLATLGIPSVRAFRTRPTSLSNTSHDFLAKEVNATLERLAGPVAPHSFGLCGVSLARATRATRAHLQLCALALGRALPSWA